MRMIPGCAPCLVQMAITTARAGNVDDKKILQAAKSAMEVLWKADFRFPAPCFSEPILRRVHAILKNPDPFRKAKRDSNRIGIKLANELARPFVEKAASAKDRLFRGIRASIAGNIADYAVDPELAGNEEKKLREAFKLKFAMSDFDKFYSRLKSAKNILVICDNAGEIAFDRVLIEEFSRLGKKTAVAVKSGPALNDALLDDALQVGLDKVPNTRIITTGQNRMGIDLKSSSLKLKSAWQAADLVLAKGQANFESLAGWNDKLFFLTMIKCRALEAELGIKKGSAIFISGKTFNEKFNHPEQR